jgi:hypothetical protein
MRRLKIWTTDESVPGFDPEFEKELNEFNRRKRASKRELRNSPSSKVKSKKIRKLKAETVQQASGASLGKAIKEQSLVSEDATTTRVVAFCPQSAGRDLRDVPRLAHEFTLQDGACQVDRGDGVQVEGNRNSAGVSGNAGNTAGIDQSVVEHGVGNVQDEQQAGDYSQLALSETEGNLRLSNIHKEPGETPESSGSRIRGDAEHVDLGGTGGEMKSNAPMDASDIECVVPDLNY